MKDRSIEVLEFFGVKYAENAGRFRYARPISSADDMPEAGEKPPVFAQNPGRLISAVGDLAAGFEQSEDAFRLNIWTRGTEGKKPVLFWIHGGQFTIGGGVTPSCDGRSWVNEEDMVFVAVNYRLDAFGVAYLPGLGDENPALFDILLAFDWVRRNIGRYGGDPDNICIGGQSAGAWYALAMLGIPEFKGQIKRAMLLSNPGSCKPMTHEEALPMTEVLFKKLGLYGENRSLILEPETVSTESIKEAQIAAAKKSKQLGVGFMPVIDGRLIATDDILSAAVEVSGGTVDVLCSATDYETSIFVAKFKKLMPLAFSDALFSSVIKKLYKAPAAEVFKFHREKLKERSRKGIYDEVIQLSTDPIFRAPAFRTAEMMSAKGSKAYVASVDYEHGEESLGACHCFDLPLIFDNLDKWQGAGMLNVSEDSCGKMVELAAKYNAAAAKFACGKTPEFEGVGEWLPFSADKRNVLSVKSQTELIVSREKFID